MKHRVFVAIGIPEGLQDEIAAWSEKHAEIPVRWLAGKNLHITLVPPWYEENVDDVRERLSAIRGEPFELRFSRVTCGPNPREPRLIWAEGNTPQALAELRASIHEALGIEPEKRPFRAHLTLARFRPEDFIKFPVQTLDEKVDWQAEVDSFVLMESHLSRAGADYGVLAEFQLV